MPNINQVISLGIGSPSSIAYFIRVGLGEGLAAPTYITLTAAGLTTPTMTSITIDGST